MVETRPSRLISRQNSPAERVSDWVGNKNKSKRKKNPNPD
jgi:hypothetical protein